MSKARTILFHAALEAAEHWPLKRRIEVLRALAEFAGSPEEAQPLILLAADLEAADQRCREFAFQFAQRPTQGGAR